MAIAEQQYTRPPEPTFLGRSAVALIIALPLAALIAASSVFQRSSWKVFQDTAMVLPAAITAVGASATSAAPASRANVFSFKV